MRKKSLKNIQLNEQIFDSKIDFNKEDIINKNITSEPNTFSLH